MVKIGTLQTINEPTAVTPETDRHPLVALTPESISEIKFRQMCFDFRPEGPPVEGYQSQVQEGLSLSLLRSLLAEEPPTTIGKNQDSNTARVKVRVEDLLRASQLNPEEFTSHIDGLLSCLSRDSERGNHGRIEATAQRQQGSRPENYICATNGNEPELAHYRALLNQGVYNKPFAPDTNSGINLLWPELSTIRSQIIDRLKSDDILTILPFVAEKRTAHKNVYYARDTVNENAIIAVSAVRDWETESQVEQALSDTQSTLIRQNEILSCFDWGKIGRACAIPTAVGDGHHQVPLGGKGLTMLAGLAWAHLDDMLQQRIVFFSDTDFIRPWEYDSLAHLGIPLIMNDGHPPRLIKTAKTGAGRNNEAWTREAISLKNDTEQPPLTRGMALLCEQLIWPLSGNLAMHGEDLYQLPFATGPGIETQIAAFYAGRQLQLGQSEIAQVCNFNPLVEDGESRPIRESALIGRCQQWLRAILEYCGKLDRPLHDWGISDIRSFNQQHGGRHLWGAYQSASHSPQVASKVTLDFMLPSLEQCEKISAIDWDKMSSFKKPE